MEEGKDKGFTKEDEQRTVETGSALSRALAAIFKGSPKPVDEGQVFHVMSEANKLFKKKS